MPIKKQKTVHPTTCLTVFGVEIDSELMEVRLPEDNIVKLRETLERYARKKRVTLREMQHLTGSRGFLSALFHSFESGGQSRYSCLAIVHRKFQWEISFLS